MKLDFRYLYTQSQGRIDRTTFWLGGIILAAMYLVVKYISGLFIGLLASFAPQQTVQVMAYLLNFLTLLAFVYPGYCLFVKRGFDRDRPAMWMKALAIFVAIAHAAPKLVVLFSAPETSKAMLQSASGSYWIIHLVLLAASSFLLYDFGLQDGTKGKNQFGDEPK